MGYLPYNLLLKTSLWIIAIIYLGIIGTVFILKSIKKSEELESLKTMFRAIALFFYCYCMTRIFFIFSDYERDAHAETLVFYRYTALAYVFYILAVLNIIFITEKYVITKTKFIITYVFLVALGVNIFLIFFPTLMPIVRYFNYILLYAEVVIILLIYLYLGIMSTGKLRTKSILTVLAIIVIAIGEIIESEDLIMSGLTVPYYSPIIVAIGATILAYAQRK